MDGALRGGPPGIEGLLATLDEYGEAVEYDLIALGLRLRDLGTDRLTWRDLLVVVRQAPQGSALARASIPAPLFGVAERLALLIEHRLRVLIWQNSGGKGSAPEPIPVPGDDADPVTGDMRWAPEPVSIDEMDELLGWAN